jgi:hypothetical protein
LTYLEKEPLAKAQKRRERGEEVWGEEVEKRFT